MEITKVCRKCGKETPFDQLVKHKQCTYGVDALCKECNRQNTRKWYQDPANKERAHKAVKAYQEANPEKVAARKARWAAENRTRVYENHLRWRNENREKLRDYQADLRENNRERYRKYLREWVKRNPEKQRVHVRNRRARRRSALGRHTAEDIRKQLAIQSGLCFWCSQPLGETYHVDHVIPLIRGGTNDPDNLVCACRNCNCVKQDRIPYTEWTPPNPLFPIERGDTA